MCLGICVLFVMALTVLFGMVGCAPSRASIESSRTFYDAVTPEYRAYVEGDEGLTDEQKARRARLLEARQFELKALEEADSE